MRCSKLFGAVAALAAQNALLHRLRQSTRYCRPDRTIISTYSLWHGMGPPCTDRQFAALGCPGTLTISNLDVNFEPGKSPGCASPIHQRTTGTLGHSGHRPSRLWCGASEERLVVLPGDCGCDRLPSLAERAAGHAIQLVGEHRRIADTQHEFVTSVYRHALAALEQPVDDNAAIRHRRKPTRPRRLDFQAEARLVSIGRGQPTRTGCPRHD